MAWLLANYWLIGILQLICIIHAYKRGLTNWIYIIIFLSAIGCVAYFIVEIFPLLKSGRLGFITDKIFTTTQSISDLEKNVRIADTHTNRFNLANAYASKGLYEKAIEIFQSTLHGLYENDIEVLLQLGRLHFLIKDYTQAIHYLERAKKENQNKFVRMDDELWIGISYFETGNFTEAEQSFKIHIQFNKTCDGMYYYAMLLLKQHRKEEAKKQLIQILDQREILPLQNKNYYRDFVSRAEKALRDDFQNG